MKPLKALICLFPGGKEFYRKYSVRRRTRVLERIGDAEDRFTHFYRVNKWKNEESVSGVGSTVQSTRNIVQEIPLLFERLGVRKVLDAPCGDYNWFRLIRRGEGFTYTGADIVRPLVDRNQELYADENTTFVHLDIVRDELPACDLWLCRDCLFHLSDNDIFAACNNFLNSNIRYLLTTTHPECQENRDIPTGAFRLLNLELPPFSFCKPMFFIDDPIEDEPARHLALWERPQLLETVRSLDWYSGSPSERV